MIDRNSPAGYLAGLSIGDAGALIFAMLAMFALAYLGLHAAAGSAR